MVRVGMKNYSKVNVRHTEADRESRVARSNTNMLIIVTCVWL